MYVYRLKYLPYLIVLLLLLFSCKREQTRNEESRSGRIISAGDIVGTWCDIYNSDTAYWHYEGDGSGVFQESLFGDSLTFTWSVEGQKIKIRGREFRSNLSWTVVDYSKDSLKCINGTDSFLVYYRVNLNSLILE